jgi:hypothetical protein
MVLGEFEPVGQLEALLQDQYGNYVVQRLVESCPFDQIKHLAERCKVRSLCSLSGWFYFSLVSLFRKHSFVFLWCFIVATL